MSEAFSLENHRIMEVFSWENHRKTHRKMDVNPLVMTNIAMEKMALIEIDDYPS
jgi:hypothetical protein